MELWLVYWHIIIAIYIYSDSNILKIKSRGIDFINVRKPFIDGADLLSVLHIT